MSAQSSFTAPRLLVVQNLFCQLFLKELLLGIRLKTLRASQMTNQFHQNQAFCLVKHLRPTIGWREEVALKEPKEQ